MKMGLEEVYVTLIFFLSSTSFSCMYHRWLGSAVQCKPCSLPQFTLQKCSGPHSIPGQEGKATKRWQWNKKQRIREEFVRTLAIINDEERHHFGKLCAVGWSQVDHRQRSLDLYFLFCAGHVSGYTNFSSQVLATHYYSLQKEGCRIVNSKSFEKYPFYNSRKSWDTSQNRYAATLVFFAQKHALDSEKATLTQHWIKVQMISSNDPPSLQAQQYHNSSLAEMIPIIVSNFCSHIKNEHQAAPTDGRLTSQAPTWTLEHRGRVALMQRPQCT